MKSLNLKIAILQGVFFGAYCVLFAFIVPLYREWGYSELMIGVLTTIIALANTVAPPLFGWYSDRNGSLKFMVIGSMAVSIGLVLFLPIGGANVWYAVLLTFLLTVSVFSMTALIDTWTLKLRNEGQNVSYSVTRSVGPFVYSLMAVGFGSMLDVYGSWIRIPVYIALAAMVIIVAWFVQAPAHVSTEGQADRQSGSIRRLMQNRSYLMFLIPVLVIHVGYNAMISFYPLLISELGGGNKELGLALFIASICQVPIIMFYGALERKFGHVRFWLALSMFVFELKGMMIAFSPNLAFSMYMQVFEVLTWGLFLPASMSYLTQIVDRQSFATATTIFFAITFGLSAMIGNFSGGLLSEWYGVRTMMVIMNSFAFLGFLWFMGFMIVEKRRKLSS